MDDHALMTQMVMGFLPSAAVGVAAELGIADHLAREPMTAEQLGEAIKSNPRNLHRLLRFLASLGIFEADADNRFKLTPLASLLRSDIEGSMRPMARMVLRMGPRAADRLIDGVRTTECPFEVAFGQPLFEFLSARPEDAAIFDAAMNGFHGPEAPAVLDAYNFSEVSTLADIGCGNGHVLSGIMKRYPKMRGIFFDQAHVIDRSRAAIDGEGVTNRAQLISGNFMESVPAGADAYHLRHIIHDWTDEPSVQILKNIRRAIPPKGRLLVVEAVVPEGNDPSISKIFDVAMMLWPKGLERTEKEYRDLYKAAGFELSGITPTQSPVSVVEGRPL
jgi:SAM-dependent methyltransferase